MQKLAAGVVLHLRCPGLRGLTLALVLAACSNDPEPHLIPGGGVGDGAIDGKLNVFVIDSVSYVPIAGATVGVGDKQKTTDSNGLVAFDGVNGPQTVAVQTAMYRPTIWQAVDGANVTVPVASASATVPQATLAGTIAGWDTITVQAPDIKAGIVLYSQTDALGDKQNSLMTPAMGNICTTAASCKWTVVSRTGTVTLAAAIIDRGAAATTVIGWATKSGVMVEDGIAQSGLELGLLQAGDLQNVTIDLGAPPAALTQTQAVVGIDLAKDEVLQLPVIAGATTVLVPKPSAVGGSTYRLTAVAQSPSTTLPAQSAVLVHGVAGTTLTAGTWLVPPTGVTASRVDASFQPVAGAKLHQVAWDDATGATLLEITVFDPQVTSVSVPSWLALPAAGALTVRASGIAADFDVRDFSLDADRDKLLGLAVQPVNVP